VKGIVGFELFGGEEIGNDRVTRHMLYVDQVHSSSIVHSNLMDIDVA
jgi:hypothetical protein